MTYDLFSTQQTPSAAYTAIELPDAELCLYLSLFSPTQADTLFTTLRADVAWQQEQATLYGKVHDLPRLTAWYGEPNTRYTYSGITVRARPWIAPLLQIKRTIEPLSGIAFNSVLLNLYRDGGDSVSWHSDDEPELGRNPLIGSVSLGQTRTFQLQHKARREQKYKIDLPHGSYLLMQGCTQHCWRHQIPKSKKTMGERINLTFRQIR